MRLTGVPGKGKTSTRSTCHTEAIAGYHLAPNKGTKLCLFQRRLPEVVVCLHSPSPSTVSDRREGEELERLQMQQKEISTGTDDEVPSPLHQDLTSDFSQEAAMAEALRSGLANSFSEPDQVRRPRGTKHGPVPPKKDRQFPKGLRSGESHATARYTEVVPYRDLRESTRISISRRFLRVFRMLKYNPAAWSSSTICTQG